MPLSEKKMTAAARKLAKRFALRPDEWEEITLKTAGEKNGLKGRAATVAMLRKFLKRHKNGTLDQASVHALFSRLYPKHPLSPGEIHLTATGTGLYFSLPPEKTFLASAAYRKRSTGERRLALEFLANARRMRFEYMQHFPMFTNFDARHADPKLVQSVAHATGTSPHEAVELLNASVLLLETDDLEKYLIHDICGHAWQADLTGLKTLYDDLVTLCHPLSPDQKISLRGNVVTFADLLFVRSNGRMALDEGLAEAFATAIAKAKISGILAPVCAEFCADIVEYFFISDHRHLYDLLPSSSLFKMSPTKLDFAWKDIATLIGAMRKADAVYDQDKDARTAFLSRLRTLLKIKRPELVRPYPTDKAFFAAANSVLDEYLAIQRSLFAKHLNLSFENLTSGPNAAPSATAVFFVNLLQIQFVLNDIIQKHLEKSSSLMRLRNVLLLFIVKYFEFSPLDRFWQLDEVLAEYTVPLLRILDREI